MNTNDASAPSAGSEHIYDALASDYNAWIHQSPGLRIIYRAFEEAIGLHVACIKGRVLDVGCGTGIFTSRLANISGVSNVVGLDISKDSLLQARTAAANNCRFVAGSATEIPFPDSSFDTVIALGDTVSHICEGYMEAISEMGRVIKPGGILMLDVDNKWNMGLLSEPIEFKECLKKIKAGHIREWSFLDSSGNQRAMMFKTFLPSEIVKLLDAAGFYIIERRGLIILPNIIPQKFHYNNPEGSMTEKCISLLGGLDRLVCRMPLFKSFGIGMLIVAKKEGQPSSSSE